MILHTAEEVKPPTIWINGDDHVKNANIIAKEYNTDVFHDSDKSILHCTDRLEKEFCYDEESLSKAIEGLKAGYSDCTLVIDDVEF